MRKGYERNPLVKHSIEFSIMVINYVTLLESNRKYVIAKQVLRSATSIGASVMEAQSAESKADFIHKLKIAAKEADESEYWLLLCKQSKNYPDSSNLLNKTESIIKVLSKIISSSKSINTSSSNLQIIKSSN